MAGFQPSKIVKLAHKAGLVDEEWLNEQKQMKNSFTNPTPTPATPVTPAPLDLPFLTDTDKINQVANMVKAKFGEMTSDQVKEKVLESTGLALVIQNLDLIIERLK